MSTSKPRALYLDRLAKEFIRLFRQHETLPPGPLLEEMRLVRPPISLVFSGYLVGLHFEQHLKDRATATRLGHADGPEWKRFLARALGDAASLWDYPYQYDPLVRSLYHPPEIFASKLQAAPDWTGEQLLVALVVPLAIRRALGIDPQFVEKVEARRQQHDAEQERLESRRRRRDSGT